MEPQSDRVARIRKRRQVATLQHSRPPIVAVALIHYAAQLAFQSPFTRCCPSLVMPRVEWNRGLNSAVAHKGESHGLLITRVTLRL